MHDVSNSKGSTKQEKTKDLPPRYTNFRRRKNNQQQRGQLRPHNNNRSRNYEDHKQTRRNEIIKDVRPLI